MLPTKAPTVWEQMLQLVQDLQDFFVELPEEHAEEAEEHLQRLKVLVSLLDKNSSEMLVAGPAPRRARNKIERLGLGNEMLRLRPRMTLQELGEHFGISTHSVSRFFQQYDKMTATERSKVRRNSVFDTFERLEELSAMIYRQLAILDAQPETHVKYIAELRQTLDLAARLSKDLYTIRKYEQFKSAVVEVLLTELPHRRAELQQKFSLLTHLAPTIED